MVTKTFFSAVIAAYFLSGTSAHMVMKSPIPYNPSTVSTSPLSGEGSLRFPCQMGTGGDYSSSSPTAANAGGNISLAFTGSAMHGGGSCQVSLFKLGSDNKVTANTDDWKVILSLEGGCPGTAVGNIQETGKDANGRPDGPECTDFSAKECHRVFSVPINSGLGNGNYALAWTWFNKIGNREMYMNCAPITISGGASDDSYLKTLPAIFTANIPGACTTAEGDGVLGFPNPGANVMVSSDPGENVLALVSGTCPVPASGGAGAGNSSAPASSPAASPASALSYPASAPPSASATGGTPSVTLSSTVTAISTITSTGAALPASSAAASSAPAAGAGCANPCSTEGALICISETQFGLCDHGCAVAQPVAAGTSCSNGQIIKRDVVLNSCFGVLGGTSAPDIRCYVTTIGRISTTVTMPPFSPPTPTSMAYPTTSTAASGNAQCQRSCATEGGLTCVSAIQMGVCHNGCVVPGAMLTGGKVCVNGQVIGLKRRNARSFVTKRQDPTGSSITVATINTGTYTPSTNHPPTPTCLSCTSALTCINADMFAVCENGCFGQGQMVAPGTNCVNDQIVAMKRFAA
jgi:hypothetical protein